MFDYLAVSIHAKYDLVDSCMRRDRAVEEISICKMELANYLQFLGGKIKALEKKIPGSVEPSEFVSGCNARMANEIAWLNTKIQETLMEFELKTEGEFCSFFSALQHGTHATP